MAVKEPTTLLVPLVEQGLAEAQEVVAEERTTVQIRPPQVVAEGLVFMALAQVEPEAQARH